MDMHNGQALKKSAIFSCSYAQQIWIEKSPDLFG